MRKNLEVVELFKRTGIDFVAIPAKNEKQKKELVALMQKSFDEILFDCEHENHDKEVK